MINVTFYQQFCPVISPADYFKSGNSMTNLIEPADGFHPSQAGNALFAQKFFEFLETEHPEALGPVNPYNEEIDAMFFK